MSYTTSPTKKPTPGYASATASSAAMSASSQIRPIRVIGPGPTSAASMVAAATAASNLTAAGAGVATTVGVKGAFNSPKTKKTVSVTAAPSSSSLTTGSTVPAATASLNTRFTSTPSRPGSTVSSATPSISRQPSAGTAATTSVYADPDSPIASAVRRPQLQVATAQAAAAAAAVPSRSQQPTLIASAEPRKHLNPAAPTAASGSAAETGVVLVERKVATMDKDKEKENFATPEDPAKTTTTKAVADAAMKLGFHVEEIRAPVFRYEPQCMAPIRKILEIVESGPYERDAEGKLIIPPETQQAIYKYVSQQDEVFDPFLFIRSLPPLSNAVPHPRKSPIPKKAPDAPNITLALDLDETLVHCSIQHIDNPDLTFNVNFNGVPYEVYVRIRPHLEYFLKQVSKWFEIIVFTASQKVYADTLLDILDPRNEYISHRVFRDSCVCVDQNYLKDLTILGRPTERVCIIDNSFQAFGFQLDNGIPIESWYDDLADSELLNLVPFLHHLKDVSDVRPYIREAFRVKDCISVLPNFYESGYD